MTMLFEYLKRTRRRYNLDKIVIEAVTSNAMKQWCIKNGFTPIKESRNYEIDFKSNH